MARKYCEKGECYIANLPDYTVKLNELLYKLDDGYTLIIDGDNSIANTYFFGLENEEWASLIKIWDIDRFNYCPMCGDKIDWEKIIEERDTISIKYCFRKHGESYWWWEKFLDDEERLRALEELRKNYK